MLKKKKILDLAKKISYNKEVRTVEIMAALSRKNKRILRSVVGFFLVAVLLSVMVADYMGCRLPGSIGEGYAPPTDKIIVRVLDVGQADCILIEAPEGSILIDSGLNSSESAVRSYLDGLGISEIEYFVISHPHSDHIGGADMIFREYTVKSVLYDSHDGYSEYQNKMLKNSGAVIADVSSGDSFSVGELVITVLLADYSDAEDDNDRGIVLRVDYGENSFVFTGDATADAEMKMLESIDNELLDCDFLKAGHHGSNGSSSAEFLSALTPSIVSVSVGLGNSYGHPDREVLARCEDVGAAVYRTDLSGDLVFECDGKTIIYIQED